MVKKINPIAEDLIRKGFSRRELVEKLDRNEGTILNWYINKAQSHLKELREIAKLLEVDICELLEPTKYINK